MPQCERHRVETLLSCGRCGKPICPDCAVYGPVGARCRDCASLRSSHIYQVSAAKLAPAAAAGFLAGTVGAVIMARLPIGLLATFWIAFLFGTIAGESVLRACGRKRGPAVEITAGLSVTAGYLLGAMLSALWSGGPIIPMLIGNATPLLIGLAIMVGVAVSRVRFL